MLIVCPTCATSYMIDPASLGAAGRSVRCARCKATWFAAPKTPAAPPAVSAFVDGVIAEAEAQSQQEQPPAAQQVPPEEAPPASPAADDFGAEEAGEIPAPDTPAPAAATAPEPFDVGGSPPLVDETLIGVDSAPSLVPDGDPAGHAGGAPDDEEAESILARRQRLQAKRKKSKRNSRWTAILLVLFAVNVAVIGGRSDVVRYFPQTASLFAKIGLPVNLRHLKFEDVKIARETTDGVTILVIEGKITNTVNKPIDVPRLRYSARNAAGREVYTWTSQPAKPVLGPNESMDFNSRLAAPPADARDIMVRFFTPQDAAAGAK